MSTPVPFRIIPLPRPFANPAVAVIQVRSLTHGCYTFKIERA